MSQFNSIFSPLTNKLARLAGITLLAVAALFASTQQMSAQTCVQNLTIALNGECKVTVPVQSVIVGTDPGGLTLLINDDSPADGNQISSISPATGFTYGVFNAAGQLVCQGTIVTNDFYEPVMAPNNKTEWEAIDTIVMWSDDIDKVLNVETTWKRDLRAVPNAGFPTNYVNSATNGDSTRAHLDQFNTFSGSTARGRRNSLSDWNRYYTGRPYFVDSCELNLGAQPRSYQVLTLDKNGVGSGNTTTSFGPRPFYNTNPFALFPNDNYIPVILSRQGTTADTSLRIQIGLRIQVKVTDDIEYNQCQEGYYAKLTRKFQFVDQRGNDTSTNQIIYFQRPEFKRENSGSAYVRSAGVPNSPVTSVNRGPATLGQFGPFGKSIRRPQFNPLVDSYGLDLMGDTDGDGLYNLFMDTISFDLSNQIDQKCIVAPGSGKTDKAAIKADLLPILKEIYTAVDTLPSGVTDSISLWDMATNSNYSVDFDFKKFDVCNNGVKYEIYTTVFNWCTSSSAPIVDTILLKFSDESAPKPVALTDLNGDGSISSSNDTAQIGGSVLSGLKLNKDLIGQTSGDSAILSVGLNDCTASLRLPHVKFADRGSNGRDLAALFNWKASDNCTGDNVTYSYRLQSRDVFNSQTGAVNSTGQGYLINRDAFTNVNYTIATMGTGTNSFLAVLGLPIGEHRLLVEAWDLCYNKFIDTLYFDVVDNIAPTMKCDDQLNITLTSNSTSNYYITGRGANLSDRELSQDQRARITVADMNEGSRDNCTLDSLFVRRMVNWDVCQEYLKWNMDYDIYGNNSGSVDKGDFESVAGSTSNVLTPKHMQYVEFFCCDGAAGSEVMVELWGSDLSQRIGFGAGTSNIPGVHDASPFRNWSWCWGNVRIEDKTEPTITRPDLSKTYNVTNTYRNQSRPVRNWVSCSEKEIIGTANSNLNGDIANETESNKLFGVPDIYGIECKGSVVYTVSKKLSCDTGYIDRTWTVTKELGDGKPFSVSETQRIWVKAHHDFTITVPADVTSDCSGATYDNISFDENGCDLLAVSAVNEKVYAASDPSENVCKKIYRTWTIINWCAVPNQFTCSSADPANFARVIPRLNWFTAVGASSASFVNADQNTVPAQKHIHRIRKVVADNDTRNIGQSAPPSGNTWSRIPTLGMTGAHVTYRTSDGTLTKNPVAAPTSANGWSNVGKYDTLNLPGQNNCSLSGINDQSFAWTYTQIIKITDNNTKPSVVIADAATGRKFTATSAGTVRWDAAKGVFATQGAPNCKANVTFTFTVTDGCAASGPFAVDAGAYIATAETPNAPVVSSPAGFTINPADPATNPSTFVFSVTGLAQNNTTGRQVYHLVLPLRDDCGNLATERIPFTVGDLKAPAPVCVQNLTATLMPDGVGGCMVVVKAIDVFQDINRDWNAEECTPSVKAEIAKLTNGVEGTKAATLTLTSADKGGVTARVYLTDGAGNADFCTVTINVEDNFCGGSGQSAAVAGAIQTETKATVEGVQVNLSGQSQKSFATGVNGLFVFNNLAAGADYTVTPSLNKGFLNGVSTFDLVLISKHILGVQPLNTPYKLIAADVNNSKSVTTLDLIQLRKLILNIDATFANNSSWRFVDATYTFPNASNPWAASFPEVKNVNDLVGSLSANFVAVKVGDVNGNAIANSTQGSVRNLTSNLGINVADMNLVAGNEYKVDFTAADLSGIEGFQFTLNLDKKGLELVDLVPGIAAEENFGIFAEEGVVTASWNGEAKGGVLFSLVVRAKSNTTLSEVLNLNSRYTAAEAYKGGEVVNVGLNFNASKASANYELYQNTPNPFAGESIIGFNLPAAGAATLTIQDVTGRTLKVINGQYAKGYNQVSLKSTELSATGVLTYTLKAADFTATRKMIIVE